MALELQNEFQDKNMITNDASTLASDRLIYVLIFKKNWVFESSDKHFIFLKISRISFSVFSSILFFFVV